MLNIVYFLLLFEFADYVFSNPKVNNKVNF